MPAAPAPLAARMRPKSLDDVLGQDHLLGPEAAFRRAVDGGQLPSVLLWGPPGCGKTTISRLLAVAGDLRFIALSAVTSGMKDLRTAVDTPPAGGGLFDRKPKGTLLFVDEIHRWNKAQQDALLPHVEEGRVVLVGATTENPGFQIIPALRSRCWLLKLNRLDRTHVLQLLRRALKDRENGLGRSDLQIEAPALSMLADAADGDARRALGLLERVATLAGPSQSIDREAAKAALGATDVSHDRDGDVHYDVTSALIKSLRGSSPDAALYWMARLLEGGEDPVFVARRLVIFASEDVGNADPRGLPLAIAAMQAVRMIGMPEARINLAQTCTFLATCPKSNASYKAMDAALEEVRQRGALPVPLHLRNAPTTIATQLGHGTHYRYPHDHPDHIVDQQYLPDALHGRRFYRPAPHGGEKVIGDRMEWWARRLRERQTENEPDESG